MSGDVQQIQLVLSPRAKTTPSAYKCYYPNLRQLSSRNHITRRRFFINLEFESMNVPDDDKIDSVNNANPNVVSISS